MVIEISRHPKPQAHTQLPKPLNEGKGRIGLKRTPINPKPEWRGGIVLRCKGPSAEGLGPDEGLKEVLWVRCVLV